MIFEINSTGRIVLRGVTDEAWSYIQSEREKVGAYDHWVFGFERYDGVVYVTTREYEDKTETVRLIDKMIEEFGLKYTDQSVHILRAWRIESRYASFTGKWNKFLQGRDRHIKALINVLKKGCKGCTSFQEELCGDDTVGYCSANEKSYELESSPVRPDYGEWKRGEHFWGKKYYPCSKCKYITEEVK